MPKTSHKPNHAATEGAAAATDDVRAEIIGFFEEMGRSVRLPPSFGRIYGLLFASSKPLAFEEICTELHLSKGAISQGLTALQDLQAVRPISIENDRRTYFVPETSMRRLSRNFLKEVVLPKLESGEQTVKNLQSRLSANEDSENADSLAVRLHSLHEWQRKLRRLLPWIAKLTVPPRGD